MVLNASYAGFLFTIVSIGISIGLWFISTRLIRRFDPSASLLSGIIALLALSSGIIAGIVTWSIFTTEVIEIASFETRRYVVVGNVDYTAGDAQHVPVSWNEDDIYLVNTTDDLLVEDYVQYGIGIDFGFVTPIPSHGYDITTIYPDYYPWQEAPQQVESTYIMDSKFWIRKARSDDQFTHK